MMLTPALDVQGVSKTFPGVKALNQVNLRLEPGSVHALLGENGAGKSTLIKIITGALIPDEGTINVSGEIKKIQNPLDAMSAGVGVVHQERNVIRDFSVGENIVISRMPHKGLAIDWKTIRQEAKRCLALLELDIDPETPMRELSAAQTQLVEIARGLYTETKVLLLDEPTASISGNEADRLFKVVAKLKEEGAAILFVSHKLEEVYAHCDTVTVLRDGQTVLESAPLSEHSREEVVNIMVGRTLGRIAVPDRKVDLSVPAVLELRNVQTSVGHRGINFKVRPGEILGIYGLVGAGRTELARSILGLEKITSGDLLVNNQLTKIKSVREALTRHRIGYVTENRKEEGVFLEQDVTRNVAVTIWSRIERFFGYISSKKETDLVSRFVDELDIKISSQQQLVGLLSGGNQQKVSLAKWLAAETRILIIDEPTVGIDVRTKRSFYELIWGLADEGLAILLITSDLAEMITLADRISVMDDYSITGEIKNTHDYDSMSRQVIRLIHSD
jgi:ribose transport system ATP-binding protein